MIMRSFCCCVLGNFRAPSPLHIDSHSTMQHGDHNRQVEISRSALVSSHLQQSFSDRGDHIFEDAVCEFQSTEPGLNVNHASEVGVSILPAGNGSTYPGMELSDKPVQPKTRDESSSSEAAKGCSKSESGDAGHSLSDTGTLSQTMQNVLPTSVSSTDKHLNWEMLFMPYRRKVDAAHTEQSVPVAVDQDTRYQKPTNLATLHEGFLETIVTRHYSEGDISRPDYADNALVDDTSLWVMSCDISVRPIKFIWLEFLCLAFVVGYQPCWHGGNAIAFICPSVCFHCI